MVRPRRGVARVHKDNVNNDVNETENMDEENIENGHNDESMEQEKSMAEGENSNDEDEDDDDHQNRTNDTAPDENTLRILLSTDNHLGYLERDPIRGLDSFAALEEVLSLARQHKCDMVLLSGDLFHENKPSRRTLHTTMEILRRYCMGSDNVGFQIISDQKECLRSVVSGRANYEDEFYSVDLPVFAIHGNHDDPTRDGGTEMLSAIDLLAVSNLVNYFGRQDEVNNVQVSPVLMQKGNTKVALFGMGSMRDERLNRMWQDKKVRFLRPDSTSQNGRRRSNNDEEDAEEDNSQGWFNIFTLHQNRDVGRGSKNCVHESMIPEWMDLVVWGHEHECLITPSESLVGTFRITQPGSSVATSLTAGEGRRKHVGILDVRGQQFRLKAVPLSSVRSFAIGDVNLADLAGADGRRMLDAEDPKVEERMSDVLAAEVESLIKKAREESVQLQEDAEAAAEAARTVEDEFDPDKRQRKYTLQLPDQVLVRLKVEHSGFTTLNNQRFGARFVGDVVRNLIPFISSQLCFISTLNLANMYRLGSYPSKANPSDILLFHRRRQAESAGGKGSKKRARAANAGLEDPMEPEDLEEINVEDLVNDNLATMDKKLGILDEKKMAEALDEFVSKEQRQAILETTGDILKKSQSQLKNRGKKNHASQDEEGGADADEMLNPTAIREFCAANAEKARAELAMEREEAAEKKKKKAASQGSTPQTTTSKRNPKENEALSDDSMDIVRPPAKKSRATTAKKPAKSRAARDDSDDEDLEDPDSPPPKKRSTTSRAKKETTTKKAASSRSRAVRDDSSDDEVEFVGTQSSMPSVRPSRARPATKPKYNYDDDSDIEEVGPADNDSIVAEDDDIVATKFKSRGAAAASTSKRRAPASSARKESQSQTSIRSFASSRKPAARGRAAAAPKSYYEDSDEEDTSPVKNGGGGWGTASSQSTMRRARR